MLTIKTSFKKRFLYNAVYRELSGRQLCNFQVTIRANEQCYVSRKPVTGLRPIAQLISQHVLGFDIGVAKQDNLGWPW